MADGAALGMPNVAQRSPADRYLLSAGAAVAGIAIGRAIQYEYGSFHLDAFPWLTLGIVAALCGLLAPSNPAIERGLRRALPLLLVAGLAFQFSQLLTKPPGRAPSLAYGPHLESFQFRLIIAAVISGTLITDRPWLRRLQIPALLIAHFWCGQAVIQGSPDPDIDVYSIHRDSITAFLHGSNPYALTFPNLYHSTQYFGPGMATPDRLLFGYTYPPVSLLLSIPGQILGGDYRYSLLLSITAAGALLAYASPAPISRLAAALFLFTPRGFFVMERGWTESYVILLVALTLFVAERAPRALGWVLGVLVVSKQYTFLLAPLFLLLPQVTSSRRTFLRQAGAAALSGTALSLPFLLWNPGRFVFSLFTVQLGLPFRPDSLNYSALYYQTHHHPIPMWLGFAAYLLVVGLVFWHAPRTTAGCAAAIGASMLAFVSVNRQAFCNYYFLIVGALFTAVAMVRVSTYGPRSPDSAARQVHQRLRRIDRHSHILLPKDFV